jgi:hypothetical protein
LRDRDRGEKGVFGGRRIAGALFEEDFTVDAMEPGVEPMLSRLAR